MLMYMHHWEIQALQAGGKKYIIISGESKQIHSGQIISLICATCDIEIKPKIRRYSRIRKDYLISEYFAKHWFGPQRFEIWGKDKMKEKLKYYSDVCTLVELETRKYVKTS